MPRICSGRPLEKKLTNPVKQQDLYIFIYIYIHWVDRVPTAIPVAVGRLGESVELTIIHPSLTIQMQRSGITMYKPNQAPTCQDCNVKLICESMIQVASNPQNGAGIRLGLSHYCSEACRQRTFSTFAKSS